MARLTSILAVGTTAAFAAGALLSQTVIVPLWQAMPPAEFLRQFDESGPVTGATIFPFEIVSMVTLAVLAFRRLVWAFAALAMLGTLILLPAYFVSADLSLLRPGFPPDAVAGALAVWSRWNWLRTALGLAAAVLACLAAWRRDEVL